MYETLMTLSLLNKWMLATLVIYALSYGVRNTSLVCYAMLTGKSFTQNSLGKVLDSLWYVGIIYFTVFVFKVFG